MAGITIPGVSDKYKTNETVEKLMQVERIPLTREQKQLDSYKAQQDAWRDINTHLTSLRDKTKTLYSYENPFNSKLTSSTEEYAVTAEANRSAQIQSFKVDVIQPATSDRFLSGELENDFKVPQGTYTYKVGEKQISINWKGGTLKEFSNSINKRGNGVIKSSVIGASSGKKSLLIEAVPTGKENRLIFNDDSKKFAFDTGMIAKIKSKAIGFAEQPSEIMQVNKVETEESPYLPEISVKKAAFSSGTVTVEPRGGYQVNIPEKILSNKKNQVSFTIKPSDTQDITPAINEALKQPEIPDAGFAEYEGIVVSNTKSDTELNLPPVPPEPIDPVETKNVVFAVLEDGTEREIKIPKLFDEEETEVTVPLSEFEGIKAIAIRNSNTGKILEISSFSASDPTTDLSYGPVNPISEADDAIIKYEGITITRSSNKIDDVVPEITLNIHDKTEKTATISVKPDVEASKDALIQFVGEYNQTVAKINILSQNKPEIVDELSYLSNEEKKAEKEKLGMFQTDFSLTSIKSNMQSIISAGYAFSDSAEITMLSQLGIATNASGYSGGYSQSKLRGYLEIDEKKLDSALENHLDDIKQLFGYDSDGDLIVDSGIAYKLDKQISAYTQTGGILALKTSSLDSKIKSSENKITKLEAQMNEKEANLKNKYSQMEGSLNSLESQQNTISNFTRQNSQNR